MLEAPVPLSSRYSYHTIFSDICKTRFNHLATRLSLSTTLIEALVLTLVSKGYSSIFERLLIFPLRFLLLYLASLFVIISRKNYLHVQYKGYPNLLKAVLGQLFCMRFIIYESIHSICSLFISLAISDCLGLAGFTSSSRNFARCYRVLICVLIPTLYTLQHCLFDLDRLSFSFDTHFSAPQLYISSCLKRLFTKCCIMTACIALVSPFIFISVSSQWEITFKDYFKMVLLSFCIFVNIEFVNVAFNAHMSIGCLHKGKPISALSSTPMETLITGLNSKRLFTKLTAFQELSFRATSSDLSLRLPIYHTRYRNTHIWPVILRECLLTIQETNESVARYLNTLENSMVSQKNLDNKLKNTRLNENNDLFGNQASFRSERVSSQDRLPGAPPSISDDVIPRRIALKDDNILLKRTPQKREGSGYKIEDSAFPQLAHSYDEPLITHDTAFTTLAKSLIKTIKSKLTSFFFPSALPSQEPHQQLSIIDAWFISKRRQAEKLVPLPVCHAECIVSLMGLLISALEEDPKGGVVSSVGEVLKCLERSVGALGRFADWDPEMDNKSDEKSAATSTDAVSILYDLSVSSFLEIVLKYNTLLNDLYLDEDVVKLSKWVLDMCGQ